MDANYPTGPTRAGNPNVVIAMLATVTDAESCPDGPASPDEAGNPEPDPTVVLVGAVAVEYTPAGRTRKQG